MILCLGVYDMSDLLFEYDATATGGVQILVVGVGGAGGNAVNHMVESNLSGVQFAAINTDVQALMHNIAPTRLQIGRQLTRGQGVGADIELARLAVEESQAELEALVQGQDLVFITAGMGGGTGTGAAPEIARMAREAGALTIGVVTRPFAFEQGRRMARAEAGIAELRKHVDTLIVVSNNNLLQIVEEHTVLREAFRVADDVLLSAVRGVTSLITSTGLINLDFADVRTVMGIPGDAVLGTGTSSGTDAALHATHMAISSPLLDENSIRGARALLINISGGDRLTLSDINAAATVVTREVGEDVEVFFGATATDDDQEAITVTVIATGLDPDRNQLSSPRSPMSIPVNVRPHRPQAVPLRTAPREQRVHRAEAAQETSAQPQQNLLIDWMDGQERPASPLFTHAESVRNHPKVQENSPRMLGRRDEEDTDRETPAFLRRSMD